jgi:hypothetical protein
MSDVLTGLQFIERFGSLGILAYIVIKFPPALKGFTDELKALNVNINNLPEKLETVMVTYFTKAKEGA